MGNIFIHRMDTQRVFWTALLVSGLVIGVGGCSAEDASRETPSEAEDGLPFDDIAAMNPEEMAEGVDAVHDEHVGGGDSHGTSYGSSGNTDSDDDGDTDSEDSDDDSVGPDDDPTPDSDDGDSSEEGDEDSDPGNTDANGSDPSGDDDDAGDDDAEDDNEGDDDGGDDPQEEPAPQCVSDSDHDGVCDDVDRCWGSNDSLDDDGDGVPNGCDQCEGADDDGPDADHDGVVDACDVCALGADTADADMDQVPDACDVCPGSDDRMDDDGDGTPNGCDACPSGSHDSDRDGVPDACDTCAYGDDALDGDGDGVPDACDLCREGDDTQDSDGDGVPDACDLCPGGNDSEDMDGDSVPDTCDVCLKGDDLVDRDLDGVPDACDICTSYDDGVDSDRDGVPDGCDVCAGGDDDQDADGDGVPDACDMCAAGDDGLDGDGDGTADACDLCPSVAYQNDRLDSDGDGTPDACDPCGPNMALGPLAHWPLSDGVGSQVAEDATGNGYDARVTDGLVFGAASSDPGGQTAAFWGDEDYSRAVVSPFNGFPATEVSVGFWFRRDATEEVGRGVHREPGHISYATSNSNHNAFLVFTDWNQNGYDLRVYVGGYYFNTGYPFESGEYKGHMDGQWHHVAVSWKSDGGRVRVYVDGEVVGRYNGFRAGYTIPDGGSFVLGQEQDRVDGGYDNCQNVRGWMSDVALYDSELNASDVQSMVNRRTSTACTVPCDGLGSTFGCAASSCEAIHRDDSNAESGTYWIDGGRVSEVEDRYSNVDSSFEFVHPPEAMYCDMEAFDDGDDDDDDDDDDDGRRPHPGRHLGRGGHHPHHR